MADILSGAVTGEMLRYGLQTIQNGRQFGPTLEMNVETLNALAPLVEQIKDYSYLLGRPREEIERFETHISEGKELVSKSKKLTRWKFFRFSHYQTKLKKKDEDLLRHLAVNLQVENRRDLMEMLAKVNVILEIIMRKENLCGAQIWGLSGNNQIWGVCGVPEEPGKCVGMDETLNSLKIELIKDGVSVHVLTGIGGSGKSTLAKKLCWDSQIKGKFGGNIFFITVSATPNLKNIVQTLFEYCGLRVPEFHNDEDAINRLRYLLRQVGRNPILLVLDDVWPGSEDLVEMLKFQMLDCKILVTSRATFTRFGTLFRLRPLSHHHSVSLFHHYTQLNHSSSYMPDKNLVDEIVKGCKGSPLALQVIAGSLWQQPIEKWKNMKELFQNQSILESKRYFSSDSTDTDFHSGSLCQLPFEEWKNMKEHLKRQTIFESSSFYSKTATETDMYYNNHHVAMHDIHEELAIHQTKEEPFEQRKRQEIIDLNAQLKKNDALQIKIKKLVGVIVALSCIVMLLMFLVVIF